MQFPIGNRSRPAKISLDVLALAFVAATPTTSSTAKGEILPAILRALLPNEHARIDLYGADQSFPAARHQS